MALTAGLCSVTFRKLPSAEVIERAAAAGLGAIEWGADVHLPPGDPVAAKTLGARCRDAGLVHMVGRTKADSIWLGAGPGSKLLTICHCCPCCCVMRVLPDLAPAISARITAALASRTTAVSVLTPT